MMMANDVEKRKNDSAIGTFSMMTKLTTKEAAISTGPAIPHELVMPDPPDPPPPS